jgi:hypothetical protein
VHVECTIPLLSDQLKVFRSTSYTRKQPEDEVRCEDLQITVKAAELYDAKENTISVLHAMQLYLS